MHALFGCFLPTGALIAISAAGASDAGCHAMGSFRKPAAGIVSTPQEISNFGCNPYPNFNPDPRHVRPSRDCRA
jgi:hypothetical protein